MLIAGLAAVPVVAVIARALAGGAGDTWAHLIATVLGEYAWNTVVLVVLVGIGAGVGGAITGWLVARRRFPGADVFAWTLMLPLAMPAYVMAYAYTDYFEYAGPLQRALRETFGWGRGDYWFPDIRSIGGAATMFVFVLYPYVYLLARTAFAERPQSMVEAARTLGLSPLATFWRVELPLARGAIAGGITLALMETLADYGTVAYFAVNTLTTGIYRAWFSLGDRAAASQLAVLLLALVVLALYLERRSRGRGRVASGQARDASGHDVRPRLTGWRAALATLACSIPVAVGFVIPVLLLCRLIARLDEPLATERFLGWAWNSVRVSAMAALIAVAIAVLITYALRIAPSRATRGASGGLLLGYAVPGAVLAIGVLLPLGMLDRWLADAVRQLTGASPGLILTGSVVALLYAYLVRYYAVAWNGIEPGFARITPSMDAASRSLGAGTLETLWRVHAPLLTRSFAAAALLVFVDVMKELPATFALRPFNFDTLATQTFQFARDERLAEAAGPSLAIVAVGLVPILYLARSVTRLRRR